MNSRRGKIAEPHRLPEWLSAEPASGNVKARDILVPLGWVPESAKEENGKDEEGIDVDAVSTAMMAQNIKV